MLSSDQEMQRLSGPDLHDADDAIDQLSQLDDNHIINEPWVADGVTGRTARLQSNDILEHIERKKTTK